MKHYMSRLLVEVLTAILLLSGCQNASSAVATNAPSSNSGTTPVTENAMASSTKICPVTLPNGVVLGGAQPSPTSYGNSALAVELWPYGVVMIDPSQVDADGTPSMKFAWTRGVKGKLTIEGQRLDASAPPLHASIPDGYSDIGLQATGISFPTEGCWEVTGKVGDAELTFVILVLNVKRNPYA